MKGTVYGNWLPWGTQVKKIWEPLKWTIVLTHEFCDVIQAHPDELTSDSENNVGSTLQLL